MSGSVSVAKGWHAEHFLCWIFGFFINLFLFFLQVTHKFCCTPCPPPTVRNWVAHAPASSMAPAPMMGSPKRLGKNKFVRTKIHIGIKFSKIALKLLYTWGTVVVQCTHIAVFLCSVRWRRSRVPNSELHVFVNFVAVWGRIVWWNSHHKKFTYSYIATPTLTSNSMEINKHHLPKHEIYVRRLFTGQRWE